MDGLYPSAGLIFDAAGNLYGDASGGGPNGSGEVFKLEPNSIGHWGQVILFSWGDDPTSDAPQATLILDDAGNLYGMTPGELGPGGGAVFQITP